MECPKFIETEGARTKRKQFQHKSGIRSLSPNFERREFLLKQKSIHPTRIYQKSQSLRKSSDKQPCQAKTISECSNSIISVPYYSQEGSEYSETIWTSPNRLQIRLDKKSIKKKKRLLVKLKAIFITLSILLIVLLVLSTIIYLFTFIG